MTPEGETATLKLVSKTDRFRQVHVVFDITRKAILQVITLERGKKRTTETFSDFVEIAGGFWPQKIERRNDEDTVTSVSRMAYESLEADAFEAALKRELGLLSDAIVLTSPPPEIVDAKQRALP